MLNESPENLIVPFEENLRRTRRAQQLLIVRSVYLMAGGVNPENEDFRINRDIELLEKASKLCESEIYRLLAEMRAH